MTNKISFVILGNFGNRVTRFTVSTRLVSVLALAMVCVAALFGSILYGYHGLRQSIVAHGQMTQAILAHREEIAQQRLQIQSFAKTINGLKDKLVKLNQFEEKLRVIANLDPGNGNGSLFGVGGTAPEDLDPQLQLTQPHENLIREMHQQVNELDTAALQQQNSFRPLLDKLEGQRHFLASTPAIRPATGWLTSRFGRRVSPFTDRKEFHKGLDIANRKGTDILATANGVVSFSGNKGAMGKVIVIDHGHGIVTRYAHLDQALKKRGEAIQRGDIIAKMGSSGRSTGPHLHYEVHLNGVPVNPAKYILN